MLCQFLELISSAEIDEARRLLAERDVPAVCKLTALSIEHVTRLRDEFEKEV